MADAVIFGRTQSAAQTPFEPNRSPGFGGQPSTITSTETQSAVEEAKATALGLARRYVITGGAAGNTTTNAYLQWFRSNPSNNTPFVLAEASELKTLSVSASTSATCTVSLLKNAAIVASISLTATTSNFNGTITGVTFAAGDKLSAQITSGSIRDPGFFVGIQTA